MHVQEAKDRCKRIFNIILFVRAKHFKQNKYSLGSNELGQLFAGNTGNHRMRVCVCTHTHAHIQASKSAVLTRGYSGCMLG